MKKMLIITSVLTILMICFAGCSSPFTSDKNLVASLNEEIEELKEREIAYQTQLKEFSQYLEKNEIYNESVEEMEIELPKKYLLMGLKEDSRVPKLTFYEEEGTFSFFFDSFSDDILEGKYKIVGNTLTANTYDDKFHYTFEVVDDTSLKFIAEKSSDITLVHASLGYKVEDRTIFLLEK